MKNRLIKFLNQVFGFFPSPLPVGIAQFNTWITELRQTYTLPTDDEDSIKFSVASMIMHLGPTSAYKSKWYFVLALRSGAAKQVAGAAFYEVKTRQAAKAAASTPVANEQAK